MPVDITTVSGDRVANYLHDVARLRITVFREFPYLYDGNIDYEQQYLETYLGCDQSVFVLAIDDDRVVGASTAIPLIHETEAFRLPLEQAGYRAESLFYCGESVLLPEYRGQGIGWRFFDERESHAEKLGGFDYSCFCAVQRPENHPLRPADYQPLDAMWNRRGYFATDLKTEYCWKDIDQSEETAKPMIYWMRKLSID